jgi:hypothetical protein
MLTSDQDVLDFFQVIFYDTLEQVFRIICRMEEITPEQEEELRRLLLRPSDVSVTIK